MSTHSLASHRRSYPTTVTTRHILHSCTTMMVFYSSWKEWKNNNRKRTGSSDMTTKAGQKSWTITKAVNFSTCRKLVWLLWIVVIFTNAAILCWNSWNSCTEHYNTVLNWLPLSLFGALNRVFTYQLPRQWYHMHHVWQTRHQWHAILRAEEFSVLTLGYGDMRLTLSRPTQLRK